MIRQTLFSICIIILLGFKSPGDICTYYDNLSVGNKWVEEFYDPSGQLIQKYENIISKIDETDSGKIIVVGSTVFNKKGKKIYAYNYKLRTQNGFIHLDPSGYFKGMEVDGNIDLKIPCDPQPGDKMDGYDINTTVTSWQIDGTRQSMTTHIQMSDISFAKSEEVQTPAGTYQCVVQTAIIKIDKSAMHITTWYSKELGPIKTEMRDAKGNLLSYSVVTMFTK